MSQENYKKMSDLTFTWLCLPSMLLRLAWKPEPVKMPYCSLYSSLQTSCCSAPAPTHYDDIVLHASLQASLTAF